MKLTVLPQDKQVEFESGANLREVLQQAGFTIKSTCGGCASCGLCVVVVKNGEENTSEFNFEEKQLLGNVFHITKERLSCQVQLLGDVSIDISQHPQMSKTKVIRRTPTDENKEETEKLEKPARQGGFRRPKAFKTEE